MAATRVFWVLSALVIVGACSTAVPASGRGDAGTLAKLPEGVVEIAAPYQDLSTVRIMPDDGCYWYRHEGPVETTYLPLRTTEGRPICTRIQ